LHDDDEIPEELRKQFLQNIISESDRLNRLIDKILDLEKLETGKQKIYVTEGNIMQTIQNAVNPLQQLLSNKNISFTFIGSEQNVKCLYDEERIIQVVTNLVSNAIKFCDGIISIKVEETPEQISIHVYNNGKNVAAEDLETIFDKFYQSQNQNIKKPIGSGLGLAISRQIVELHQGKIWATNHDTEGVTFTFTLPKS